MNINDRSQHILKALVSLYIRDGQPVSSKTIAEEASLQLSPATIRNIMADLEEAGYVQSPHTSAGRVPTSLGYRFFVDSILQIQTSFQIHDLDQVKQQLNSDASEQELIETASAFISNMTQLAGLVTIPRHELVILRHIEFLPLSNHRVLVILVLNEREVQNLIIHVEREYSQGELQQATNFLMAHYAGMSLVEIRTAILSSMHNDHQDMESVIHTVFNVAEKTFHKQQDNYVIAGESHLLNFAEETGVRSLRTLFDAFTQKQDILHLLDQCIQTTGIQIFIGKESGYEMLEGCSFVTAPYSLEGKVIGVLGVIGPTRMDYERVISAVDVTAKLLGAALKERQSGE